ncbi:hypothetical protein [Pseudomonas oryzihabitans]|uniref:hypothetical protein n=1 Tax=Pseudomonas oryzihabitans TaxID=47885 RepID=UPI00289D2993|nr:hypothetical protein [Pseudomonas oryzihabitans]
MSRLTTVTFTIRMAWWVKPYLFGVLLTARLTGLQPDPDRVGAWVKRGMTMTMTEVK